MSNDPRAIIFDLDGVLADSEGLHVQAWQRLFAGRRLPFEPRWAQEWVAVPDVDIAAARADTFTTCSSCQINLTGRTQGCHNLRNALRGETGNEGGYSD